MRTNDNAALYEQSTLWSHPYLKDPYYKNKVQLLRGMVPQGVKRILDIGCGNGAITNELVGDYWTVGADRSWAALAYLRVRKVQISADALPFRNKAFDLVMSNQMIEHLPDAIFQDAIAEMSRVAGRYLLVSIPYKDPLLHARACCRECGCKYNVWGHLRSFHSINDIRRLFPLFTLRIHAFCGRENEYPSRMSLWCRQWLGGDWTLDANALCPHCGSTSQYRAGFPRRAIAALTSRFDRLLPKTKAFWWLVCLFERK